MEAATEADTLVAEAMNLTLGRECCLISTRTAVVPEELAFMCSVCTNECDPLDIACECGSHLCSDACLDLHCNNHKALGWKKGDGMALTPSP